MLVPCADIVSSRHTVILVKATKATLTNAADDLRPIVGLPTGAFGCFGCGGASPRAAEDEREEHGE
jgi:hypothetical protein